MNKPADMRTFDREVTEEIERSLDALPFTPMSPEVERERTASAHRMGIARYEQRIADTKRQIKADVGKLEAERKAEKQRHDAEMAAEKKRHDEEMASIAEAIAAVKADGERDIASDRRLAASCHAALDELIRE